MQREVPSCRYCGSTVRWRSIIHALSTELFGKSLAIPEFATRKDIAGLGLSDWTGYADRLAEKLAYVNTFYDCEPKLNISSPNTSDLERYDFLLASDVFEHVLPPVSDAFRGSHDLLRPGGVLIFSVPYVEGQTAEHYPELHSFAVVKQQGKWILRNETKDGRDQSFADVIFHGGPGSTIEMRLFGKASLRVEFERAGFRSVCEVSEEVPEFGIYWRPYDAESAPYRPMILGLDTPPWVARR
jgi:hypothetical protein